ncbi:MAG: hypothetical protein II126_00875 [Erysipelotrichaceae bacterium]|nr:hypothetical protein [Erysipelotrichaceae bacterium]
MEEKNLTRAQAYKGARSTLLTLVILTAINVVLLKLGIDLSFFVADDAITVSAYLASYGYYGSPLLGLGYALAPLALMLACYFLSARQSKWLLAACAICVIDVARLAYYSFSLLKTGSLIASLIAQVLITGYLIYGYVCAVRYYQETGEDITEIKL